MFDLVKILALSDTLLKSKNYCAFRAFFQLYFGNLNIYIPSRHIYVVCTRFHFQSCYIFICRQAKMDKVGIRMDFIFEVGRLRVSFTKGPFKSSLGWVKASSGWEMIVEILLYSTLCYQILRNVLPKLVHAHTAWIWIWMAKRPGVTFDEFQAC